MSTIKANIIQPNTTSFLTVRDWDGWLDCNETWTYASADAPTFTLTVVGDVTTKYSVGMKCKLTQTTVKYFIITAIAYGAPNTTITLYGGTDYTLTADAISLNYVSHMKAPYGFPMSPAKWTIEVTDSSIRSKSSPVQNVWYNLGSFSITIPIGMWRVSYAVTMLPYWPGNYCTMLTTLSTANNSDSDADFRSSVLYVYVQGSATTTKNKILSLANKTVYYLNSCTIDTTATAIYWYGHVVKTSIRAECAYL